MPGRIDAPLARFVLLLSAVAVTTPMSPVALSHAHGGIQYVSEPDGSTIN